MNFEEFECPFEENCPYRQFPPEPFFPPPTGGPGQPPGGPHGGPEGRPPMGPPPSFAPSEQQMHQQIGPMAVSPGSIRPCTFRFVYIWPRNGRGFWAYLIRVDRRSAAGWRWNGRRWVYFGIDLRRIDSFYCY